MSAKRDNRHFDRIVQSEFEAGGGTSGLYIPDKNRDLMDD
jgi:hypothetical protein